MWTFKKRKPKNIVTTTIVIDTIKKYKQKDELKNKEFELFNSDSDNSDKELEVKFDIKYDKIEENILKEYKRINYKKLNELYLSNKLTDDLIISITGFKNCTPVEINFVYEIYNLVHHFGGELTFDSVPWINAVYCSPRYYYINKESKTYFTAKDIEKVKNDFKENQIIELNKLLNGTNRL